MSDRFITYVIIGVAFGFTQLWFAYWVVKLYKEKQRILKERKAGGPAAQPARAASAAVGSAPGSPADAGPSTAGPSTAGPAADRSPTDAQT